jgi:hypothetical protein
MKPDFRTRVFILLSLDTMLAAVRLVDGHNIETSHFSTHLAVKFAQRNTVA